MRFLAGRATPGRLRCRYSLHHDSALIAGTIPHRAYFTPPGSIQKATASDGMLHLVLQQVNVLEEVIFTAAVSQEILLCKWKVPEFRRLRIGHRQMSHRINA